jgi:cell division GTPase FtsZ
MNEDRKRGNGTGAARVIVQIARNKGALVIVF